MEQRRRIGEAGSSGGKSAGTKVTDSAKLYTVHIYQCANDKTILVTPYRARYGEPYLCNLCRRYMKHLYAERTDKVVKGMLWNPKPGDL